MGGDEPRGRVWKPKWEPESPGLAHERSSQTRPCRTSYVAWPRRGQGGGRHELTRGRFDGRPSVESAAPRIRGRSGAGASSRLSAASIARPVRRSWQCSPAGLPWLTGSLCRPIKGARQPSVGGGGRRIAVMVSAADRFSPSMRWPYTSFVQPESANRARRTTPKPQNRPTRGSGSDARQGPCARLCRGLRSTLLGTAPTEAVTTRIDPVRRLSWWRVGP